MKIMKNQLGKLKNKLMEINTIKISDIASHSTQRMDAQYWVKSFKILTSHNASELNRLIQSHIEDGWSIVGSHQVQVIHQQNRFAGSQHKDTICELEYSISIKK